MRPFFRDAIEKIKVGYELSGRRGRGSRKRTGCARATVRMRQLHTHGPWRTDPAREGAHMRRRRWGNLNFPAATPKPRPLGSASGGGVRASALVPQSWGSSRRGIPGALALGDTHFFTVRTVLGRGWQERRSRLKARGAFGRWAGDIAYELWAPLGLGIVRGGDPGGNVPGPRRRCRHVFARRI